MRNPNNTKQNWCIHFSIFFPAKSLEESDIAWYILQKIGQMGPFPASETSSGIPAVPLKRWPGIVSNLGWSWIINYAILMGFVVDFQREHMGTLDLVGVPFFSSRTGGELHVNDETWGEQCNTHNNHTLDSQTAGVIRLQINVWAVPAAGILPLNDGLIMPI